MSTLRSISLLEKVLLNIKTSNKCWEWQGQRDKDGYGVLTVKNRPVKIHRYIYQLAYQDPGELQVLHTCDNPSCIRPSHLWIGTSQENTQDKIRKGRARYAKGEETRNHYLTTQQVLAIRREYEKSDKKRGTAIEIAKKHNLNPRLVRRIIRRERWAWL